MIEPEIQSAIDALEERIRNLEKAKPNETIITPLLGTRTFGFGGSLSSLSTASGSSVPSLVFVNGILTSSKII